MSKKATKAADNIYYIARSETAERDDTYNSREKASEIMGIDRTRLARIELGSVCPYPEEVLIMADRYNKPELCNHYCATDCPIGRGNVKKVELDDFDRLSLKALGSLKDVDSIRESLIAISEDGVVDNSELQDFEQILEALDKISTTAQALSIWTKKNIKNKG
ncbi:MAG: helix-turn-helix transcriptional regulator [Clostridia bacterium]|nr:helix-turn-helix transcriptional regulator [Clostridia bacterium]